MENEKLKMWLGFAKFFLGTFALGLIATVLSNNINTKEFELKEQTQIARYLEHAIKEDVGVRYRFSQYFATVTRSEEVRNRWQEYLKLVKLEYDEKSKRKQVLESKIKSENLTDKEFQFLISQIEQLRAELSAKLVRDVNWISAIEQVMPKSITNVQLKEQSDRIVVKGTSPRNQDIADLITNIEKGRIGDPILKSIRITEGKKIFELEVIK